MSKKLVTCKACGAEIAKNAKACPHCGAKNKKPIFKKWWFWLIVLVVIGSIGNGGDDTTTTTEPTPTTPATIEATAVPEVAEPVTETATEPATVQATEPEVATEPLSTDTAVTALKTILELSLSDFDYYDISADETGVTVSLAIEGVAEEVATNKMYGIKTTESWETAKNSMVSLANSISESAEAFGLNDYSVTVCVLNDQNHDNVLLMIMYGIVVYDAMAN